MAILQSSLSWLNLPQCSQGVLPPNFQQFVIIWPGFPLNGFKGSTLLTKPTLASQLENKKCTCPKLWWKLAKDFLSQKTNKTLPSLVYNNRVIDDVLDKCEIFNNFFSNIASVNDTNATLPNLTNSFCVSEHNHQPLLLLFPAPPPFAHLSEIFNNFFSNIASVNDTNATLPNLTYYTDARLGNIEVREQEVLDQLLALDISKASGPDIISPSLLKMAAHSLVPALTYLINMSLWSRSVPRLWKQANVCPIYKKGHKSDINKY